MIERIPRRILMLILLPPVALLVVIGLVNFDLMVSIVVRLIPVIAIVGVIDFNRITVEHSRGLLCRVACHTLSTQIMIIRTQLPTFWYRGMNLYRFSSILGSTIHPSNWSHWSGTPYRLQRFVQAQVACIAQSTASSSSPFGSFRHLSATALFSFTMKP